MLSRRSFLQSSLFLLSGSVIKPNTLFSQQRKIMTVNGPVNGEALGNVLIHEHILVDFTGAAQYDPHRWNRDEVVKKVLPYLLDAKKAGCKTLVDCTPNYLGRDVILLQRLSKASGLHILTNTGYYGGSDNKFLPAHAFTETADELAARWMAENKDGINGTGIKPGFMKISVNSEALSDVSKKLITAAALCHLQTGLTIASHTGPAVPAFEQLQILKSEGVLPDAFIWVHAQSEKDWTHYREAARLGAWVSLDGLSETNVTDYTQRLLFLKKENCLHRTLVSHDAGWYDPNKSNGGDFRGYTTLFTRLIPALRKAGFAAADINRIIRENPRQAFGIRIRRTDVNN